MLFKKMPAQKAFLEFKNDRKRLESTVTLGKYNKKFRFGKKNINSIA